jgi:hypothetical protein
MECTMERPKVKPKPYTCHACGQVHTDRTCDGCCDKCGRPVWEMSAQPYSDNHKALFHPSAADKEMFK